jgi:DNA invertase Pin-like site-specific DNA recombinase
MYLVNYLNEFQYNRTTSFTARKLAIPYFFSPAATAACRNQDIRRIMNVYGYARVSTNGQALDAQVEQLLAAGCVRIFQEKISGHKRDRAELKKLLRALRDGDVLLVTRLDRLARSTRDFLNILALVSDRSAGFRSLSDGWADTTTAHGRLMMTVLAGVAEFERDLIKARTAEGRARAVAMGVRLGRRPKLNQEQRREACARKLAGEDIAVIARDYNVSDSTISRLQCG